MNTTVALRAGCLSREISAALAVVMTLLAVTRTPREPLATTREADPPVALDNGATFAVVKLIRIDGDCSNAGGSYFTFELDSPGPPRFVHGGGHDFAFARPGRDRDSSTRYQHDDRDDTPLGYYVAEISPTAPFRFWDPGWGLQDLPTYIGAVGRAAPARDRREAMRLLPYGLARSAPSSILDFRPAPGRPDDVAIPPVPPLPRS